jgi:hypothetical protein
MRSMVQSAQCLQTRRYWYSGEPFWRNILPQTESQGYPHVLYASRQVQNFHICTFRRSKDARAQTNTSEFPNHASQHKILRSMYLVGLMRSKSVPGLDLQ